MVGREDDLKNNILYGTKKIEMILSSTRRSEIRNSGENVF